MPAVQFYGHDAVIEAAESRNCPAWGVFIGRNLFMKYEGTDMQESIQVLSQTLQQLQQAGTAGIYTFKAFEQPETGKLKITEKTICDGGSFNFKMIEEEQRQARAIGYTENSSMIMKQLQLINERLDKIETDPAPVDDEHEPETIGSIIREVAENPEMAFNLIKVGRAILGYPTETTAAIGNINTNQMPGTQQQQTNLSEQDYQRIANAVETLAKYDANLVAHLEKLAAMATNETMKFKMLIGML